MAYSYLLIHDSDFCLLSDLESKLTKETSYLYSKVLEALIDSEPTLQHGRLEKELRCQIVKSIWPQKEQKAQVIVEKMKWFPPL